MNNEDWSSRDDHIVLGVIIFFHGAYVIAAVCAILYGFIQWWTS
jgi:hypothetical protein